MKPVKVLSFICLFFLLSFLYEAEGSKDVGEKCKNGQCNGGLHCCGFPKKCQECCQNSHCPANQKCKNKKCVDKDVNSGPSSSSGNGGTGKDVGEKCENGQCIGGLHCCGFPKKCQECCQNSHCLANQKCKNKKCVDKDGNSGPSSSSGNGGSGKDVGEKCKNGQCNGGLHCCGFPKKCQECCQNSHCLANQKCKNKKCVDKDGNSGTGGTPQLAALGDKCKKTLDCEEGECCGVWPFKKCKKCCSDEYCNLSMGYGVHNQQLGYCYICKKNECIDCRE